MTMSYHERIGRGLALLKEGLAPFVERELKAAYGKDWQYRAADALKNPILPKKRMR
ncbi:MAG TPA: Swt1 family HEPN domain-containing protein [Ktedonobacteraceae bacterium]|jgi:hypothetical protein|nr:Swt1 family HEPN domain-containing protein [Ktedonobacteraceae bacterium]